VVEAASTERPRSEPKTEAVVAVVVAGEVVVLAVVAVAVAGEVVEVAPVSVSLAWPAALLFFLFLRSLFFTSTKVSNERTKNIIWDGGCMTMYISSRIKDQRGMLIGQ
jgi:hypothetical protein